MKNFDKSCIDPYSGCEPATDYDKAAFEKGMSLPLNQFPRILDAFNTIRNRLLSDFPAVKNTKVYVYPFKIMQCYGSVSNNDANPDPLMRNFIMLAGVLETDVTADQLAGIIWRTLLIKAFTLSGRKYPDGKTINKYLNEHCGIIVGYNCPACGAYLTDDYDRCPKCKGNIAYSLRQKEGKLI